MSYYTPGNRLNGGGGAPATTAPFPAHPVGGAAIPWGEETSNSNAFMPPAAPVLEAGLLYGQQRLQEEIHKGKETIMPFYDQLRLYFCVDHAYVVSKLALIVFPFYPRKPPPATLWQLTSAGSPASTGAAHFGSFPPPRAMMDDPFTATPSPNNNGLSGMGAGGEPQLNASPNSSDAATSHIPPAAPRYLIPFFNPLAFDLYIPVMALITYLILSVFVWGAAQDRQIHSAYFLDLATSMGIRLGIEVGVAVGLGMVKPILLPSELTYLDVAALLSYKYVLLSFSTLVLLFGGQHDTGKPFACLYILAAIAFFSFKITYWKVVGVKQTAAALQVDGSASSSSGSGVGHRGSGLVNTNVIRLSALLITLVQIPCVLWGVSTPFSV